MKCKYTFQSVCPKIADFGILQQKEFLQHKERGSCKGSLHNLLKAVQIRVDKQSKNDLSRL